jgi:hypothetical protein
MTGAHDELRATPRVLFVYYTYSQQAPRVVEAMAAGPEGRRG